LAVKPAIEFSAQLDSLKEDDNLSDWIYLRIQHAGENPSANLNFLMATQKESWRKFKTGKEKEAWLYLLVNQAYYQLYTGDILKSIEKYEEAHGFLNKTQLKIDAEEYILKPLANNYTRIGDYERAIFIQNKSLTLSLKNQNNSLSASIYNNLAISYLFKKEYKKAESAVKNGLRFATPNHEIYGLLYSVLADINFQEGLLKEATKNIQTSIHYLQKRQSHYWLLSAYTLAGNIKFKQQLFAEADRYYDSGISIIQQHFKNARKRELAHLLIQKGKIAIEKGNHKKATVCYNEALSLLIPSLKNTHPVSLPSENSLFAENKLLEVLQEKSKLFKLSGDDELALKTGLLAFYTAEKIRNEYTYTTSKQQIQAESKLRAEQIINEAYLLWLKTKKPEYAATILLISEKTKARILLDEMRDNQQKLASKNPAYAEKIEMERAIAYYEKQEREHEDKSLTQKISELRFQLAAIQKKLRIIQDHHPLDAPALLQQIPANTKVLSFFFGEKFIFLIDARKGKINHIKRIENAAEIRAQTHQFLNQYFYNGPSAMVNAPEQFYHHSYNLYARLFAGIQFRDNENLLLIKDGILNLLSFEGLVTEEKHVQKINNWPFFIKKAKISYGFSLNTIVQKDNNSGSKADVFNGFFLSNTGNNPVSIPEAEVEHDHLKSILEGGFFKNEKATIDKFKESFSRTDVLHISSHAYISPNDGEPVLELYKNKFYLFELGGQFNVPKLVILSACQTADGTLISGEGIMSLSRGFIASGTKGVISGLWKVNDESGAKLMSAFYQNLLGLKDAGSSLRQAKLNWINAKNQNKVLLLPYYWDSLVYAGNTQEIHLQKPLTNWKTLSIFAITSAFLFVLFWLISKKSKNKKLT
jgi:CHAT domain-containing protein